MMTATAALTAVLTAVLTVVLTAEARTTPAMTVPTKHAKRTKTFAISGHLNSYIQDLGTDEARREPSLCGVQAKVAAQPHQQLLRSRLRGQKRCAAVAGRHWTSRLAKRGSGLGFLRNALQDAFPTCEYRVHFEGVAVVAANERRETNGTGCP